MLLMCVVRCALCVVCCVVCVCVLCVVCCVGRGSVACGVWVVGGLLSVVWRVDACGAIAVGIVDSGVGIVVGGGAGGIGGGCPVRIGGVDACGGCWCV